jgi:hypothetical protein
MVVVGPPEEPQWQSGKFEDYAWLLLGGSRTWIFYPFLIYPVTCLLITVLRPQTASRYFLVRFGVYSGVVLAVQYVYVLGAAMQEVEDLNGWKSIATIALGIPLFSLVAVALPVVAWFLLCGAIRLWQSAPEILVMVACISVGLGLVATVVVAAATDMSLDMLLMMPFGLFFLLILGSFAAAPTWAAAVYTMQSIWLWRLRRGRFQLRLWQALAIFTWIAAYLAAWRAAVVLMLQAYAELPTEPPGDCYIATAAARGHGRIVGSREVVCRDGSIRRVNLQLAYFKCGELALQATAPQLHGILRSVYDALGPRVARLLVHPLIADAAYLALKPLEWPTRAVLAVLVGDVLPIARKMYRSVNQQR